MKSGPSLILPDLLADLHVHLLGTGDTAFWRSQLEALPNDLLLEGLCRSSKISVASLLESEEVLRAQLVIPSDFPPGQHDVFDLYLRLRQSIAGKNQHVLKNLIVWNAERYKRQGVYYVEFSVGVSWLAEELFACAIREGIVSALAEHGVHVRILLGFNRKNTNEKIHNEHFLTNLYNQMDAKLDPLTEPQYFECHLKLLKEVTDVIGPVALSDYVVGYDYMGDERHSPYPPFLLPEFIEFLEQQRHKNHRFGIRLHAGELTFPYTNEGYVSLRINEYFLERCWQMNIPTRIGHGMGTALLKNKLWEKWAMLYGKSAARIAWKACYETFRTATMEICLTSNYVLVGKQPDENPAIEYLLDAFSYCVLGTDDPQVFGDDLSLKDEFLTVINRGLITEQNDITRLVKESLQGSFAPPAIIEAISNMSCLPSDQDPPDAVIEAIRNKIDHDRPHKAIDQIWKEQSKYRRSSELSKLRFDADEALRDLNFREGFDNDDSDWTPPALR